MIKQCPDQQTPLPTTVAAWFVLGIAPPERIPWWAAQWLADGCDGPALRELAGLDSQDPRAVNDLLPAALADLCVTLPSTTVAAADEAFRHLAALCLSGRADERWVAQRVDVIVRHTGYDDVLDLPLGQIYAVDDAWQSGWGPPVEELKATVRAGCEAQFRAARPKGSRSLSGRRTSRSRP